MLMGVVCVAIARTAAMARGFGAEGVVVDSEKALGDALLAAHAKPQVTLIAAKIDASGYVAQFKAMWGV